MARPFMRFFRAGLIAAAALPLAAAGGTAADYPTKPVRFVVGFAPGGGSDTAARGLGNVLAAKWGQQVVVDNRPGASGTIAADITVNAPPDGYTLLLGTIALVVNPHLVAKMPFDTLRDLAPVTRIADQTNILVVNPSVPANSVKELIALARSKPLNAGSSGIGGAGHLAIALFNMQAGTSLAHVAYKGGGPAMVGLLGGDVQLIFATSASSIAQIKAGKIKPLAVTTLKRSALVPDVPTLDESGLKGFEANNWNGLFVTAKTPKALVTRLNRDVVAALSAPELKEQMFRQGLDAAPESPEAFATYCKAEYAKWGKVVKAAGLKPQ
ncbi:MAG TPA: tripartite tricarboxylate transporter substrate binding protein [Burkholderiales bacterium]|nr:tripartite tricarboxylate transporter substrate binding protein [Burkholderiales bacterium]